MKDGRQDRTRALTGKKLNPPERPAPVFFKPNVCFGFPKLALHVKRINASESTILRITRIGLTLPIGRGSKASIAVCNENRCSLAHELRGRYWCHLKEA
jgi:hypothetical protein